MRLFRVSEACADSALVSWCTFRSNFYIHHLAQAVYHDCSPCNVLSEASVADLNSRLEKKVSERNFRPNVLVSGCPAFEEVVFSCLSCEACV